MESFSIEFKETIVHKCPKKRCFRNNGVSIRAWVENLHIKNCVKNLMVAVPSYIYKDTEDRTWKPSVKKAILVTSEIYKLHSTLYWCFR